MTPAQGQAYIAALKGTNTQRISDGMFVLSRAQVRSLTAACDRMRRLRRLHVASGVRHVHEPIEHQYQRGHRSGIASEQ